MNKKAVAAVAIVLVAGVVGYLGYTNFISKKTPVAPLGNQESQGGLKSLKDLLSSGVAQKCTFTNSGESGSSEGTSYVSGGKVRADFTTVTSGKTTISHMISDGKTSYIWTEGDKSGFTMTVSETSASQTTGSQESTAVSSEADLGQKADYKCSAWITDSSYFTPPGDIKFSDFSEMFKASPAPGVQGTSSSQCSACDSLSGDDKTQCQAALNCK
jgi:hypothetical protein